MKSIVGFIFSYIFVFSVIMLSTLLTHRKFISGEASRKFIHIGVSNWWIIAMLFFETPWIAAIPPATFVIINYYSYKNQTFSAMERDGGKGDLGTVYFAISLLVLSLLTFREGSHPYIGALGILIMGYGDGFAAVFGTRYSHISFKFWGGKKTPAGSLAMLVFSFLAAYIILIIYNPVNALVLSLKLAIFATILELISPSGLDNLTVPLMVPALYVLIV